MINSSLYNTHSAQSFTDTLPKLEKVMTRQANYRKPTSLMNTAAEILNKIIANQIEREESGF